MFGLMQCLSACLNCMVIPCFYVFTLEENASKVVEDIELVDQEYQAQETFEQGKLPSILQLRCYFQIHYTQWFWRNKKNLFTYV